MVSFRPRLTRIIGHRWPIALILTASMAGVILAVITVTAVLEIRQERNLFRRELETRGRLLADTLNDTLADSLYFLDVDEVEDITSAVEMSQDALPYIKVFRTDGSLLTDTSSPKDARSNLAPGFVRTVIQNDEPVLEFHGGDLEVTSPIKAGNQLVGIVHFDLSTASLNGQLTDITWDLVWQGLALFAVAALLAFAVARYVTRPLRALGTAALSIGSGNLDEKVPVVGPEETASLGQALDSMRTELKGLYQDLEGQVADRTKELSEANESLATEIVDRQRLAQESQLMAEIGQVISSSLEIEEVYERFAALVRGNLPFDWIAINTVDVHQDTLTLVQVAGMEMPNLMAGMCMPLAGTFTEQVIQSPEGVIFQPDNLDQPNSLSLVLTPFFQAGCCSFLGVPLVYRGKAIGILNLASTVPQAYSPQHLELAMAIGQQIAGAIANAQQFAERKQAEQESRALADLGRIVSSSLNIEEVYQQFRDKLLSILPFDWVTILTLNPEEGTGILAYHTGPEILSRKRGSKFKLAGAISNAVAETGEAVHLRVTDVEQAIQQYPGAEPFVRAGARNLMGVPLRYRNRIIAVMVLCSVSPTAYTPKDLELASRVGDQIAGAIANAELYAERLRAEEAESRAAKESGALAEIGRVVTSSLDMSEVFEVFTRQVRSLIPFDQLEITVIDQDRERDEVVFSTALSETADGFGESNLLGGSLVGQVAFSRAGLTIQGMTPHDIESAHPCLKDTVRAGFLSWLVVPLIHRDESIGALFLTSRTEIAFTQRSLELAERIANQISGAMANAQLYAHLGRAEQDLRNSEERFRQIAENAREVFFLVDHKNYKVLYVNRAFEELWGRSRESLYEQPSIWLDAIHPRTSNWPMKVSRNSKPPGSLTRSFVSYVPTGRSGGYMIPSYR